MMMMTKTTRHTHPTPAPRFATALAAALATALITSTTVLPAQEAEDPKPAVKAKTHRPNSTLPMAEEKNLVLLQYTPTRRNTSKMLADIAYNMWGRQFVTEVGSQNIRRNIFQSIDSVVIYDEAARAKRILAMLQELDRNEDRSTPPTKIETAIIAVKYAGVNELQQALRAFSRAVPVESGNMVQNIEFLESRSCIIVRDERANLDAIRDIVAKLDTPRPQVMLTCWVIRGSKEPGDGDETLELPENLVGDLKQLVALKHFAPLGMGLLNSAVEPRNTISMNINLTDDGRAELNLNCRGFDEGSNVLHLNQCSSQLSLPAKDKRRSSNQAFSTQLSLKTGEFTVLGAMGSEPVFVVLKVDRTSRTN